MTDLNRKPLSPGGINPFDILSEVLDLGQLSPSSYGRVVRSLGSSGLNWSPRSDGEASIVDVEVPGVNPEDISVKLEGRQITVTTPRGNLMVPLGTRIDSSRATASLKNGMLTIRIPKREAATVEIKVETN